MSYVRTIHDVLQGLGVLVDEEGACVQPLRKAVLAAACNTVVRPPPDDPFSRC
jgi:hypothetical protein